MNEVALKEQITRLENEFRLGGTQTEQRLLELRAEIDRVRLEMAAVRTFLDSAFPSFAEQFPLILARTLKEVNPEFE
jgi:hypothetical protein